MVEEDISTEWPIHLNGTAVNSLIILIIIASLNKKCLLKRQTASD